jgi:hypothetical protein
MSNAKTISLIDDAIRQSEVRTAELLAGLHSKIKELHYTVEELKKEKGIPPSNGSIEKENSSGS